MTLRRGVRSLLLGLCVVLSMGFGPVYAQATLVADYRFDDVAWCTPASALDSVGGHNGTLIGSVGWQDSPASGGKPVNGAAVSFSSGAIDITGLPLNLAIGASNSVSFWMYWDGVDNAMPLGFGLHDLWLQSGSFGFNTFNSDIFGISSAGLSGGWHHVAAVFTNGNVAANSLWIDGVPQGLTQRSTTPNNTNAVASSHLRLSGVWGNSAYLFGGSLDVVRIYSGLLTQSQVDADRALSSPAVVCPPPPAPTLVTHYRLEDAWDVSHTAANTVSGGASGNFSTAYPSKIAAPAVSPNKPNTCFGASFSTASGPLLSTGNVLNLNAGGKNSVSFWMYWNGGDSQMPFGFDRYDLWLQGGAFGFNSGNSDIYGISSTGLSNGWHHVAAVFTNGNIVGNKLWIDGAPQVLSQQQSSPNNTVAYAKSTFQFSGWAASSGYRFAGSLDELKVYQGEMTDAMVLSDFTDICGATPLTCITDNFSGGLNPTLWNVSGTGYTPQAVSSPTVPSNRLRLTDYLANLNTMAQLKKWFPAANNKVVIEFDYYVYDANYGADGMAVVLSDASVPLIAGGYGGSLGYANRYGINGFNGGWLGIGLDEHGNYPYSSEGRRGYPTGYTPPVGASAAAVAYKHSIAVRGSGVAQSSGYALLANTGTLSPALTTTSAVPQRYRFTIDHSNSVNAWVTVERNTGSGYTTVIPAFDAKGVNSGQAAVPTNLILSFTGSTGGAMNYHEIGNVQVCATRMTPPGGSVGAANFDCIESNVLNTWSTTARHPLYTKLVNTDFKFDIVALKSDGTIENGFVAKDVTVELFDDTTSPGSCSAYASPVASQTVSYVSGGSGRKTITNSFNLSKAWGKLRCRVTDTNVSPTVYGCSTDQFSVRPSAATLSTSAAAAPPSAASLPTIKAGANFTVSASTSAASSYSGSLVLDTGKLSAQISSQDTSQKIGGVVGTLTPSSIVANAAAVSATYSEVGYLYLAPGAYRDQSFTAVDRVNGDCITNIAADANLADTPSDPSSDGKYGCDIGNKTAVSFGRFIPDHFAVTPTFAAACSVGAFSYMDQPFATPLSATVEAQNSAIPSARTQNYSGAFAKAVVTAQMENANSGSPIAVSRLNATGSPAWDAGRYTYVADRFLRLASGPDGPYDALDIGLAVSDEAALAATARPYLLVRDMDASNAICTTDLSGLSVAAGVCTATKVVPGAKMRYGRLRLSNKYGSSSPVQVQVQAQYWGGASWLNNASDSCTSLANSNIKLSSLLPAGWTAAAPVGSLAGGNNFITLTAPAGAKSGSVNVCTDLDTDNGVSCSATITANFPWLQSKWPGGANYNNDPSAQATFGIFSAEGKKGIYNREIY